MQDLLDKVKSREWFYAYALPDGSTAPTWHGGELDAIHDTRWSMLAQCLRLTFPEGFENRSAIDLAAHQGWFSLRLAQAGFGRVRGVEARAEHVEDSRLMAELYGAAQAEFTQADVFALDPDALGAFDVVLMLGLLYHLENPVGALRLARRLCSGVCLIETQLVPGMTGMVDYGSYRYVRPLKGSFGLIDETGETHGKEASVTGICLVPSLEGLLWLLDKVGFARAEVLQPPAEAYEQLLYGKRVMVAAWA